MRVIHTALYNGWKSFRFSEMTVGLYCLMLEDYDAFLMALLWEFQDVPPLSEEYVEVLMEILLECIGTKKKESRSSQENEWHLTLWIAMRELKQPYDALMQMPMRTFVKILDDLDVITGTVKLSEKRKDPLVATKELFTGSTLKAVS